MKAVILAGGGGTRLWPVSRSAMPKQFHAFTGNRTLLQQTFDRLSFLKPSDIFVSTNKKYAELVKKQLPHLQQEKLHENLIIEPETRDTAPGICFAANHLAKMGFKNEVMAIVYADHLIQRPEEFKKALEFTANHVAQKDILSVIGVRAKYPNPNLGYIKLGRKIPPRSKKSGSFEIYELDRFTEKPDIETAKKFIESGKYLWNTGLYVWKVGTILEKFAKFAPDVYEAVVVKENYAASPKISIDYAVMERIGKKALHVVPAEFGWNDIGNWSALHEEMTTNETHNIGFGEQITVDTEGSVVIGSSGKLVVTYGVKNMIVIDTPEALLVMPKERSSEVKKLIEEIKKLQKGDLL
ncbi:MAG: sugar phosphate nucleotidyltransferase [Patescibacteria group bacterium]